MSGSVKHIPAVCEGDRLVYRLEVEEPSKDDEVMNAAKQRIGETSPEAVEAAKAELVELLKSKSLMSALDMYSLEPRNNVRSVICR